MLVTIEVQTGTKGMVCRVGVHAALQKIYDPKMPVGLWGDMVSVLVHRV